MKLPMKKLVSVIALLSIVSGVSGCASWIKDFKENPAHVTATVVNAIETAVEVAKIVFFQVKNRLPLDTQNQVQPKFDQLVLAAENAKMSVQDALTAAADANNPKLDLSALIAQAGKTVADVQSFIGNVKDMFHPPVGAAVVPLYGEEELKTSVLKVQKAH
jgi:hypothetical protein